jgi:hypothetical protein
MTGEVATAPSGNEVGVSDGLGFFAGLFLGS